MLLPPFFNIHFKVLHPFYIFFLKDYILYLMLRSIISFVSVYHTLSYQAQSSQSLCEET